MSRLLLIATLVACGGKAQPASRPADYGARVVTDMKAFADRECQCADRMDAACAKTNTAERDMYVKRIDRSRPFSGAENAQLDGEAARFQACERRGLFVPIVLE